ncbi:MAG: DUF6056 family protein [Clostridiales bacterium]|nr:DUF6056 family protein [Clostridiales bacterium]
MNLRENLTDRQTIWHRRIFCLLILAFFIILCFCSPYALDDWFYGSSSGISCMNKGWSTLNGRYLSNMLMLVFSRVFWIRSLFMGLVQFGICYLIYRISDRKNSGLLLMAAFLYLMTSRSMFVSNIVWSPGFSNYTFSPFLVLVLLALLKPVFEGAPEPSKLLPLGTALLGLAGSLVVEHVTVYLCIVSVLLLIYCAVRYRRVYAAHVTLLVGVLAGTAFMFSNPIYQQAAGEDSGYYSMSLSIGSLIQSVYNLVSDEVMAYLMKANLVINLVFAIVMTLLVMRALRRGELKPMAALAVKVCLFIVIGASAYFVFLKLNSDVELLLKYTDAMEFVLMIAYFTSIIVILFLCIPQRSLRDRTIFEALSIVLLCAPLAVASPVKDRCFTPMYVFWVLLTVEIAAELCRTEEKYFPACAKAVTTLFLPMLLTVEICFGCIYGYIRLAENARMDSLAAQVESGATTVTLEELPYSEYVFRKGLPTSQKWFDFFKDAKGIDSEVEIEIVEFDGVN